MLPESPNKKSKSGKNRSNTYNPAPSSDKPDIQAQLEEARFSTSFMAAVSSSLDIEDICSLSARVIFDYAPFQRIVFYTCSDVIERKITYSPTHKKGSAARLEKITSDKISSLQTSPNCTLIPLTDKMGSITIYYKKGHLITFSEHLLSALAIHFSQAVKNAAELCKMRDMAMRDGLTGLFNRRIFDEMLTHKIGEPGSHPVSLLLIDLDNFKLVNDNYGHQAGDQVLKCFAQLLKESCRGSDLVARFGGEEFAVILPCTQDTTAFTVAQRLRKRLSNMIFTFDDQQLKITVSIGLATSISGNPILTSNVIKRADTALYQAKLNGKNQVCCHQTDLLADPGKKLGG